MLPATDTAKQLVVRAPGSQSGAPECSMIPWDLLAAVLKTDSPFPVKVSYAFISSSEIGFGDILNQVMNICVQDSF